MAGAGLPSAALFTEMLFQLLGGVKFLIPVCEGTFGTGTVMWACTKINTAALGHFFYYHLKYNF